MDNQDPTQAFIDSQRAAQQAEQAKKQAEEPSLGALAADALTDVASTATGVLQSLGSFFSSAAEKAPAIGEAIDQHVTSATETVSELAANAGEAVAALGEHVADLGESVASAISSLFDHHD